MREKPILFSAPMVRAILEGRKTQTRRVIKPQPEKDLDPMTVIAAWDAGFIDVKCPYGKTGDRLWVRENFWKDRDTGSLIGYVADYELKYQNNRTVKKIPSIHMPRVGSRITLEVADIRVERLQDITQSDACAEGVLLKSWEACDSFNTTPERKFCKLWKDINGPESWDKNPFVWVIEFKVLEIKGN